MVRGKLKKVAGSLMLGVGLMSGSVMAGDVVEKPKVLIFDVNETLLDLASMRSSVGEALGEEKTCCLCGSRPCCIILWCLP